MAWTEAADRVLRDRYVNDGAVAVAAALGRTTSSIHHRAIRIGVLRRRRWTAREDRQLRLDWGTLSLKVIAASLGRHEPGVYSRAQDLGLCSQVPQGLELLSHAGVRTGFDPKQLRVILAAAGHQPRPVTTRARQRSPRAHRWLVDSAELDMAIEEWLSTESLGAAARRSGVADSTLARWLVDGGVARPALRHKHHWRVPTATVDRIVAARLGDSRETLREAAMRIGVTYPTLGTWLKDAGVAGARRPWRTDRETVDRVVAERRKRRTCRARQGIVLRDVGSDEVTHG